MIEKLHSPRGENQPFIWFADYGDSMLTEFNNDGSENNFKDIQRESLKQFGLLGRGAQLYSDIKTGQFDILGSKIDFSFDYDDRREFLTSQPEPVSYNDVITFKSAYTDYDPKTRCMKPVINGYFFGYKTQVLLNGNPVHFKAIYAMPIGQNMSFGLWISSKEVLTGSLVCFINGVEAKAFPVAMQCNEGKEFEWFL